MEDAPPLARISGVEATEIEPVGEQVFTIEKSRTTGDARTFVSPDIAVCDECLAELFDPDDRRYRYPFINCTNCGPRFTITMSLPYDRPNTTMADFSHVRGVLRASTATDGPALSCAADRVRDVRPAGLVRDAWRTRDDVEDKGDASRTVAIADGPEGSRTTERSSPSRDSADTTWRVTPRSASRGGQAASPQEPG